AAPDDPRLSGTLSMNGEKWDKAGEVFARALEVEPELREAFVVEACGGDATLLAEVRDCLAAYETESFLERQRPISNSATTRAEAGTVTSADTLGDARATRVAGAAGTKLSNVARFGRRV